MATLIAASSGAPTTGTPLKAASSNSVVTSTKPLTSALAAQYAKNGLGTNGKPLTPTTPTAPAAPTTNPNGTPVNKDENGLAIVPQVSALEQHVTNVVSSATAPAGTSSAQSTLDQQTQQQLQTNYYNTVIKPYNDAKAQGILSNNSTPPPATYQEYYQKQNALNQTKIDNAQKATNTANTLDQNALNTQINQGNSAIAGTTAAMAQGREGPMGSSAPLVAKQFSAETQAVLSDAQTRVQAAIDQRDQAMTAMKEAQQNGDMSLAQQYEDQYNAANRDVQQSKIDLMNATNKATNDSLDLISKLAPTLPSDATPTQIQQYAAQYGVDAGLLQASVKAKQAAQASDSQKIAQAGLNSAIDTFTKLNTAGVTITPEMIQTTADATGINPTALSATAAAYNQNVAQINADKTLNTETKQVALQKAQQDFKDQMNGLTTDAAKNSQRLLDMINGGYPQEVINDFKKVAFGSEDYSDPMTQAKLQYQLAQTDTERQNAYINAVNNGLNPGAVIAQNSGSGYQPMIDPNTGKFTIGGAEDGTKGGQCGHFVNQVFGSKVMGNSYQSKLDVCDPDVGFGQGQTPPQPGMAFVMPVTGASKAYGHTGIFLGVDPNRPGMALVKDSNWGENEVIQTHSIPLSEITGYATPPNATQTNGSIGNMTNQQILQNADAQGIDTGKTVEDKMKYVAGIRMQGFLPGQSKTNSNSPVIKPTYEQYGKLADTDFNPGNSTDKSAAIYLDSYIKNGVIPSAKAIGIGTSKGSSEVYANAVSRANDLFFAATGQSLPDVQVLKSNKDLITANNKLANNLKIQEGTVSSNFQVALDNMEKNDINKGWQSANTAWNALQNSLGDPATATYLAQNVTLQNELGNLIAVKNASGTTVQDKLESAGLLPANATVEQQKSIISKLMLEAKNGQKAIQDASSDLYKQIDPLERLPENPNRAKAQNQAATQQWMQGALDFGRSLIEDNHAQTGLYGVPEDHQVLNQPF